MDFGEQLAQKLSGVDRADVLDSVRFGAIVVGSLIVSHLSMVSYIAYNDLNGYWDKWCLKPQKNTVQIYLRHLSSFLGDVILVLFPCLCVYAYFYANTVWAPLYLANEPLWYNVGRWAVFFVGSTINNYVNRLWAMAVHWAMHNVKGLYKIHKKHHCLLSEVCALSAWQDSWTEFIGMEVFGVFLFAQLFNPLPWQFHMLLAVYNGIGGAIDHSGFYIPDTWIDGRYHWDHHFLNTWNYSEIESLDRFFGTLYIWKEPPEYLNSPRLQAAAKKEERPVDEGVEKPAKKIKGTK